MDGIGSRRVDGGWFEQEMLSPDEFYIDKVTMKRDSVT